LGKSNNNINSGDDRHQQLIISHLNTESLVCRSTGSRGSTDPHFYKSRAKQCFWPTFSCINRRFVHSLSI